ncbi:MAG: hypothetical protein IT349_20955 [Candidatus Eisenbacteria bacterium]|nr:hypothetical protein [Candidatus Eisenbacteria bacterium]
MTSDRIDPSSHLDWETLFEQAEGKHTTNAAAASHLTRCNSCAAELARVRELHERLTAAALPPVPEDWISAARVALGLPPSDRRAVRPIDVASGSRRWAAGMREVWASLVAGPDTALVGVRGTAVEGTGARVLAAAGYVVSISESLIDGQRGLQGQVIPPNGSDLPPNAIARALLDEQADDVAISEYGEFGWKSLPAGCPEIDVLLGDLCLRIPLR